MSDNKRYDVAWPSISEGDEGKDKDMSMPRGAKIEGGYASISDDPDAMNFRAISEAMTRAGHKMNHSSARNYLLRGVGKFAEAMAEFYGADMTEVELERLSRDPDFQDAVRDLVIDHVYGDTPDQD